jgi:hypothetical protein
MEIHMSWRMPVLSPLSLSRRYLLIVALTPVGCLTGHAQTTGSVPARTTNTPPSPSPVVRDPSAISLLQQSVAAMGGLAALRAIPAWTIDATETWSHSGASHPVRIEAQGEEYRIEHRTADGGNSMLTITSGGGKPSRKAAAANAMSISPLISHSMMIGPLAPRTLQRELANPNYTLRDLGPSSDGTQEMILTENHTTSLDRLVSPQTWYIDKATFLPAKVIVHMHNPKSTLVYGLMGMCFSGYRTVGNVLIPYTTEKIVGSTVLNTTVVTAVSFSAIRSSEFEKLQ